MLLPLVLILVTIVQTHSSECSSDSNCGRAPLPHLEGKICTPDVQCYKDSISRVWNQVHHHAKPKFVVLPKGDRDVVEMIKYAAREHLSVSVLGGGHNAAGRGIYGDVVIDMALMNNVHVDPSQKKVYVHGGATWRQVDSALHLHGLATPGGVVHETGVVGLALGGGWGFLTKKHGLTADNVLEITIVTPDGNILTCSANSHPDLFWALLGTGAGTFGVVTHIVLQVHEAPSRVFHGIIGWPAEQWKGVIDTVNSHKKTWDEDRIVVFPVLLFPDPTNPEFLAIALIVFVEGGNSAAAKVLDPLKKSVGEPPVNLASEKSYFEAQSMLSAFYPSGRYFWKSKFIPTLSGEIVEKAIAHLRSLPPSHALGRKSGIVFENYFRPNFRGNSQTSFSHRPIDEHLLLVAANWDGEELDEKMELWAREFVDSVKVESKGSAANFVPAETSVENIFGKDVAEKFTKLKNKYDPKNMFTCNVFQKTK